MDRLLQTLNELRTSPPSTLREAALAYAAAGLPVFPCAPGGKTPLTHTGFQEASTRPDRIRGWWAWQPGANVGIATGHGVDVLDIDVHRSGDGYAALESLYRAGLVAGALQAVRTPSGGAHLYYPSDLQKPRQSWSRGTSHVDFRGIGGYIIAPPSAVHVGAELRPYRQLAIGGHPMPGDADTIRDLLTPPRPSQPVHELPHGLPDTERLASWLATAAEGNRNSSLFWAACRLAELGMDESTIRDALDRPARTAGLEEREINTTVHSAWRSFQVNPDRPGAGRPFRSRRESVTR
jgi:hypothetical protein